MYVSAYDPNIGCLLQILDRQNTDQDFAQMLRDGERLDQECRASAEGTIHILITSIETERPNANWRKRFSEATANIKSQRYIFALVAPSILIRGVMTAINWLSPPPKHFHLAAHPNKEEAFRWVEKQRGQPIPILDKLYEEALAKTFR